MTPPSSGNMSLRLEACFKDVLHDVMRTHCFRDFTLPPEIRPIIAEKSLAGPAFTIVGRMGTDADAHESLIA